VSAGIGSLAGDFAGRIDGQVGFSIKRTVVAAIAGGTASTVTGGKFASGALSSAMSQAFGDWAAGNSANEAAVARQGRSDGMPVLDHAMGRQATSESNIALKEVLGKLYDSLDLAAEAWSDIIVPIAKKYNTEIASKFFERDEKFFFGRAHSDGVICTDTCSVTVFSLPEPANSRIVGYIHTHPDNVAECVNPNPKVPLNN
jgi:hypothetical protein